MHPDTSLAFCKLVPYFYFILVCSGFSTSIRSRDCCCFFEARYYALFGLLLFFFKKRGGESHLTKVPDSWVRHKKFLTPMFMHFRTAPTATTQGPGYSAHRTEIWNLQPFHKQWVPNQEHMLTRPLFEALYIAKMRDDDSGYFVSVGELHQASPPPHCTCNSPRINLNFSVCRHRTKQMQWHKFLFFSHFKSKFAGVHSFFECFPKPGYWNRACTFIS